MRPTSSSNRSPAETSGIPNGSYAASPQAGISQVHAARSEYEQAVADYLDAIRRYSQLPLDDSEKKELLRQPRDREQIAFATYKQSLDAILTAKPVMPLAF